MAGANVESNGRARGGRRAVDSEINMIPMIDLLVCCISFLLITAVWSHMSRIPLDARVAGRNDEATRTPQAPDKVLHVDMKADDHFVLVWKQGKTVLSSLDVPRRATTSELGDAKVERYPDLGAQIDAGWKANGSHQLAHDTTLDTAVLHTNDKTPFQDIVAVIDAIHTPKRALGPGSKPTAAFNVSFAVD